MKTKHVKYEEGQWFAIPLRDSGYALGIIVRGRNKTRGGLGYFFGPRHLTIPSGTSTLSKNKDNAILVCRFGDLGIIQGDWPLIKNGKLFDREDWPVPTFRRVRHPSEEKTILVEYSQDYSGHETPMREILTNVTEKIMELPRESFFGYGAVEIRLTKLLKS